MRLEVVSDVVCPWCFIGKRNMDAALAELAGDGIAFEVGFRPYRLNPDLPPEGADRQEYMLSKFGSAARIKEIHDRVEAAGRAAGIEFRFDLIKRAPNTLAAHHLLALAAQAGCQPAVKEALMAAYFTEGRDIGSPEALAEIAAAHGIDPAGLNDENLRQQVAQSAEVARNAGISGVPSFLMNSYLLFSGAMPPDALAENFRKARAVLMERGEG
jgi:predicted DsbA family dithiol-disulfide isomerase